jgi:hypothetical protein
MEAIERLSSSATLVALDRFISSLLARRQVKISHNWEDRTTKTADAGVVNCPEFGGPQVHP